MSKPPEHRPTDPEPRPGRRVSGFGIILGVDPGTVVTGWGLVRGSPSSPELVDSGVIRTNRSLPLADRLNRLYHELDALVTRHRPVSAGVESPFHGVSARAALQLAHARGVVLAVLGRAGLQVDEYPPATVKKSVTGSGSAPKDQVGRMVARILGLRGEAEPADLTDALAVALCHLTQQGFRAAVATARGGGGRPRERRAKENGG